MVRTYPAIEITWPFPPADDAVGHVLAVVDDHGPVAVEDRPLGIRVFFGDEPGRDSALPAIHAAFPALSLTALLVPDENWAERSQAALRPVQVDRIIVSPPWALEDARATAYGDAPIVIAIQPSMGFGTGHHQSTRLCLRLLQRHLPSDASVLDIGTGSGVLAIAARVIGASRAVGIDFDPDALTNAAENVALNDVSSGVELDVADITEAPLPLLTRHGAPDGFDVVLANITGATLQRHAARVASTLAPGGVLIASGFQTPELDAVTAAFAATGLAPIDAAEEDTWMAAAFRRRLPPT